MKLRIGRSYRNAEAVFMLDLAEDHAIDPPYPCSVLFSHVRNGFFFFFFFFFFNLILSSHVRGTNVQSGMGRVAHIYIYDCGTV